MFGWLFKRIPPDSWAGCHDGFYVNRIRKELDNVAGLLVHHGYSDVRTRFNCEARRAELYNENGLVAHVRVHGEMGCPDEVFVACNLSVEAETVFSRCIPGLKMTFKALTAGT